MKIELIDKKQYDLLIKTFQQHPNLVYQNKGYDYIKVKLSEEDIEALGKVTELLKGKIVGFSEFNNFRVDKQGRKQIRFQYNYGAEDNTTSFIGVGYILIDELLNGFK